MGCSFHSEFTTIVSIVGAGRNVQNIFGDLGWGLFSSDIFWSKIQGGHLLIVNGVVGPQ